MKDTEYAYCVARLRATEDKLLKPSDFERLISFESEEDALTFLKEKGRGFKAENSEEFIEREKKELYDLLSSCVPFDEDLKALFFLNDYFNIKALLKSFVSKKEAESFLIYPTNIDSEVYFKAFKNKDFSSLGEKAAFIKEAYDALTREAQSQNADLIIDRASLQYAFELSKEKGLFGEICAFLCDSSNMKIALRGCSLKKEKDFFENAISSCVKLNRSILIDCASESEEKLFAYLKNSFIKDGFLEYLKSPLSYEGWSDRKIIEIASKGIYTSFGFDPVCLYYYKRSFEIKAIGIALACIKNGISKNEIKERVSFYV